MVAERIVFEGWARRDDYVDAWSIRLGVQPAGVASRQLVNLLVPGTALREIDPQDARLVRQLVSDGIPLILRAIADGAIPTSTPGEALTIPLSRHIFAAELEKHPQQALRQNEILY